MTGSWRSGQVATLLSRPPVPCCRSPITRPATSFTDPWKSPPISVSSPTEMSQFSSYRLMGERRERRLPLTAYLLSMTEPATNLPVEAETPPPTSPMPWLEEMPPRQIVTELDRYIVGQEAAKKAVAIAVRNRWRRAQAPDEIRDEITPYNIIMIGPTGVGKTEVARRLARLSGAPFIKVEASKFTEVGYVGRDAESMVRDLVDSTINLVRTEREDEVYPQAEQGADERLLDLLLPSSPPPPERGERGERGEREEHGEPGESPSVFIVSSSGQAKSEKPLSPEEERRNRSREKLRTMLS